VTLKERSTIVLFPVPALRQEVLSLPVATHQGRKYAPTRVIGQRVQLEEKGILAFIVPAAAAPFGLIATSEGVEQMAGHATVPAARSLGLPQRRDGIEDTLRHLERLARIPRDGIVPTD
jgi:hypothetical protein